MKKAYIIRLTDGGGDTDVKLVDQETWNWVILNDPGKPGQTTTKVKVFGMFDKTVDINYWEDQLCPQSIRDRIKKEYGTYGDDFEGVQLSAGSWDNDRAIFAPILEDDYNFSGGGGMKEIFELIERAKVKGYEVDLDNEYVGVMY